LPFTGYDSSVAAGLGAAMVAGGLMMRRRLRRV
jgi:LPXTG-motif cell wall-anchored protein